MIAIDTNALIRILIEDDAEQAKAVKDLIIQIESKSEHILILLEVLIETVWVLESVYDCTREEIADFLEMLARTSTFVVNESSVLRYAVSQYRWSGDFADLIIVGQAKRYKAEKIISFDKKLMKKFPDYVLQPTT